MVNKMTINKWRKDDIMACYSAGKVGCKEERSIIMKKIISTLPRMIVVVPLFITMLFFVHPVWASVGGDLLWETVDQQGGKQEAAASVIDASGNSIITGYSMSVGGNEDFYTAKIDNMGVVLWRKFLDMGRDANEPDLPSEDDRAVAVALDSVGNIVVVGYGSVGGNVNVMAMKYDSAGNDLWAQPYVYDSAVGGSDYPSALAIDSDDNIYIAGYSQGSVMTDDAMLIKLAADGSFIRVINFDAGNGADDRFTSIATGNDTPGIPDDDFVVATGYTWVDHGGGIQNFDILTVKFNSGGVEQWRAIRDGDNGGVNSSDDRGLFVAVDPSYNVVVSGYVTTVTRKDMFTIKYGAYGDGSGGATALWAAPAVYSAGEQNIPHGLWLDNASGDVFVTCATFNNDGMDDFYTAGYAGGDGSLLWQQVYDSPGTAQKDIPMAITGDGAGGLYVTGYTEDGVSGDKDLLTLKYYQSNGHLLWHDLHDGPLGGIQQSVQVAVALSAVNGSVFITGWSGVQTDFDTGSATEAAVDNYTITDGSKINWLSDQWKSYYVLMTSGANQGENRRIVSNNVNSLTVESAFSNPVQTGDTFTINNPFDYDYYVVDYDRGLVNPPTALSASLVSETEIDLAWQDNSPVVSDDDFCVERCQGYDCQDFSELACFPADTLTSPDQSYKDTTLSPTTRYSYRVRTKNRAAGDYSGYTDAVGAFTNMYNPVSPSWLYIYNGPDNSSDEANAIAAGPDNNPVVTGKSNSLSGQFDYYTAKIDHTDPLTELWSHRYDDPSNENDKARCVSVDSAGDVFLAGYSSLYSGGTANTNDIFSFKFAATGPDPNNLDFAHNYGALWMAQYSGPGGGDDRADAVDSANDGSADVVVGYGKNAANNDDIYVVKYLADGSEAWPGALPFDGGAGDYPSDVAFDVAGDVLVSGSTNNGTDDDMFLRKLSGVDGSVVWTMILDSGYGNDGLNAVTTDAAGDVYVAGYIFNGAGNSDMYFAKYARDGNVDGTAKPLWTKIIAGDGFGYDEAVSLSYDARVNEVLVAGMLTTTTGSVDFHVRRYDVLGNLIWKKTLDRDVADDFLVSMAIDRDGDICLAGNTDNGVNTDILAVCYDGGGTLTGSTLYNGTANADDGVNAMTVNPLGEMYLAGYTVNAAGNKDYLVIKAENNIMQAPGNFTAVPRYNTVDLSWDDNSSAEDSFYIWRKDGTCASGGAYNNIYMSNPDETSFMDSGLTQGSNYCYRIQAMKGGISSIPVEVDTQTSAPPSPGCNASTTNTTQIDLSWNNTAIGAEGIEVLRCAGANCGNFSQLAVLAPPDNAYSDASSCELATNSNDPYSYRIRVYNNTEGWEAVSDCANVYPTAAMAVNLNVDPISEGEVELTWGDINTDTSDYKIYRCEDTGGGCTPAYLTTVSQNNNLSGELLELQMSESAWTGTAGEIIDTSGNGINATAQNGAAITTQGRIGNGGSFDGVDDELDWHYPNGRPANNFTMAAWVKAVDTHEIDPQSKTTTTGTSGQHWLFGPDMAASNDDSGAGVSVGTNGISVYEHSGGYMPPLAVYQGNIGTGWNYIVVTYTDKQPHIYLNGTLVSTGWASPKTNVYAPQKAGGGPYGNFHGTIDEVRIFNRALSTSEVEALMATGIYKDSDANVLPGHTYNYQVTANKTASCNWEGPSASGTASPILLTPCPLNAAIIDSNTVDLDWADNFGTEDGYHVDRCAGVGCVSSCDPDTANCRLGTTASDIKSVTDYTAVPGTSYTYQVEAFKGVPANWAWLSPCTVDVTLPVPPAPDTLQAARYSEQANILNWNDANDDETGFEVERCEGAGCSNFVLLASVPPAAGQGSYIDNDLGGGLLPDHLYRYRIRAVKAGASGWPTAYSNEAEATPTIVAPDSLAAKALNSSRIDLTWVNHTTWETGFSIGRCEVGVDCPAFTEIATIGPGVNKFQDMSACENTTFRYQVTAVNPVWTVNPYTAVPAEASTPAVVAPYSFIASPISESEVAMSWLDSNAAKDGFTVERCNDTLANCTAGTSAYNPIGSVARRYPTPPPADYTLHYKMDEISWPYPTGTDVVADSAGVNPGSVSYMSTSNPFSDVKGRAANFANLNYNYIKLKNPIVLSRNHSTLSWWMRPATTNNSGLFSRVGSGGLLSIIESRSSSLYAETDSNCNLFSFNGVVKNRDWTMYSIVFDNAHAFLYINGKYFGEPADYGYNNCDTSAPVTELVADTTLQYIGAPTGYTTSHYTGQMDEVGAFNRALSAAEIKALYDSMATKFTLNMEDTNWNSTIGEVTDSSFAGHSGTAYGNTTPASMGEHHGAAYFDGNDDYITLGDIDELDAPSALSISLWFNRTADQTSTSVHGVSNVLIAQTSDTNNDNLVIGSQGTALKVYVDSYSGADSVKSIEANIQNNTWYHLVLTYEWTDPNPLKIYLDGTLLGQWSDYSGYLASSVASQLTLGIALPESSLLGDFKGYIDDVSVSTHVLDAAEVEKLYHGTYVESGLVPLTTYTYRVTTDRNAGCQFHVASTPQEVTMPSPPGPTNVTATGVDTTSINITWSNKAGSATANRVLRCKGAGCTNYVQIGQDLPASSVSYSDTDICEPDTYRYRIAAVVGGVEIMDQDGPAEASPVLPTAPGNLTGSSPSETETLLSWDDNMSEESGYKIERCLGSGCASTQTDIIAETDFDFVDNFSNGIDATTWNQEGHLQTVGSTNPPINLADTSGTAVITAVNGAVDMVTTSTGSGVDTQYNYSRISGKSSMLTALGSGNFDVRVEYNMPDGNISNTLTQNFIPLRMQISLGADLIYVERGFNAGNNYYSAYSKISSVTGNNSVPTSDTSGKLRITRLGNTLSCYIWTINGWSSLYSVQAATSGVVPTWIGFTSHAESNEAETLHTIIDNFSYTSDVANNYNYLDRDAGINPPGTTYTYKVYPFKGICLWDQNYASQVEVTTQIIPPANLRSGLLNSTEADVLWDDTTTSESGFEIERCAGSCVGTDPFVKIDETAAGINSYSDRTLLPASTYSYRVRAVNSAGGWSSGYSNILIITTSAVTAPSSLVNNPGSEARIELAWNRNSTDESSVVVQRGDENCANFVSLPSLPAGTTSYTDTSISAATTYCYQVQVCKADIDPGVADNSWCSPFSNQVLATSSIVPPDPLSVDFINTTEAHLKWVNSTESETGFVVERCEGNGCTGFTEVAGSPLGPDVTSFTDNSLCSGTTYRYRVKAVNGSQWSSDYTVPLEVTSATPVPVNDLAAKELVDASDSRQINVSWTDANLDEDGFSLERCEGAGCSNFQALSTVPSQEDLRLGIDPTFWTYSAWLETLSSTTPPVDISDASGSASISETNGGVDFRVSSTGGGSGYNAAKLYLADPGTLLGNNDFDLRVDYTLPEGSIGIVTSDHVYMRLRVDFPDPDGTGPLLSDYIYVQHMATSSGDGYQVVKRVNNVTSTDWLLTSDTSGTLRITRSGNVLTGSAWTAGAWATGQPSVPILADSVPDSVNFGPNANRAEAANMHVLVSDFRSTNIYSDTNITPSTDYCYRVTPAKSLGCAWDPVAENLYSVVCSKTAPAAPSNLLATVDGMAITLDWSDNSADETGFEIEKMLDNGRFVLLDTVGPGVKTYTNTTWIQPNTTYSYRVRAIRGDDKSAFSNVINATTLDWQEPICVQP